MQTNAAPMPQVASAIAAFLRRLRGICPPAQSPRALALKETIALDPRRRVHLVRCGDKHVLLLTGGTQDQVIGWVDAP